VTTDNIETLIKHRRIITDLGPPPPGSIGLEIATSGGALVFCRITPSGKLCTYSGKTGDIDEIMRTHGHMLGDPDTTYSARWVDRVPDGCADDALWFGRHPNNWSVSWTPTRPLGFAGSEI